MLDQGGHLMSLVWLINNCGFNFIDKAIKSGNKFPLFSLNNQITYC
jgi:hypothetical protein